MTHPTLKWSYRLAYVAPLGLKLYDTVARKRETRLNVVVFPKGRPSFGTTALPNQAGAFVLRHAHGLGDLLRDAGEEDYWDNLNEQRTYTVRVSDPAGRFIPFTFDVDLPHRGYVVPPCMAMTPPPEPPETPPDVIDLYPSATYREPPQKAVIRAQLYDPQRGSPAAYAVVDAVRDGRLLGRGIAGPDGGLLLVFDYPAPNGDILDGDGSEADRWTVALSAHYTPYPEDEKPPAFADICRTFSQGDAELWEDWSGSDTDDALTEVTLIYRERKILYSSSADESLPKSRLFITPTG